MGAGWPREWGAKRPQKISIPARLTGRAEEREILATADVLDRSRTRFDSQPKPLLVKGKERSITAYSVGPAAGENRQKRRSGE